MPAMQTIRWGIIGCGDVTEVKSGPAFQKADGSALVAVMRRDAGKAADYARRHGVPRWYDDADKLIADAEVDAVYVATPPGSHEEYALRVCRAGKPCYVEKPMARTGAEARRMTQAFSDRGLPLFVAYYRRGMERFQQARRIIQSGRLGPIRTVSYLYRDGQMSKRIDPVPWRLQREHSGGGLFLDLGSHALDLLDFFFGPLQNASGEARSIAKQYDVEDQVELTFTAGGNIKGTAQWDFTSAETDDLYQITGERASLRFSCFGSEPVVIESGGKTIQQFEFPRPAHVQQGLIQAIVNDLRGDAGGREWISTGAVGQRTQEVMDRAIEGFYRT
jgi:1,5-anhydro-D-fructose reductase (1,5-anhydro-D-mannitol-forming)